MGCFYLQFISFYIHVYITMSMGRGGEGKGSNKLLYKNVVPRSTWNTNSGKENKL